MERSLSKKSELISTLTPLFNSYIILAEVWFFWFGDFFFFLTYLKSSSLPFLPIYSGCDPVKLLNIMFMKQLRKL